VGYKCCGCGKPFVAGDHVVTFRMEQVRLGEKSNQLGFYNSFWYLEGQGAEDQNLPFGEETTGDHVHFTPGCLEKTFSPVDNPFLYDVLANQVRQKIYDEESDREPDEILPDLPELIEDPPACLWCKRTDTVWVHFPRGYPIYNCIGCSKLWDHEEDELYWDHEKGDYFLVR
jgi:hypothetical protein